jgi:GNAT superfamily N-acetyltransferase
MNINIRELTQADVTMIKEFTDRWIGLNYYAPGELESLLEQGRGCSLGAFCEAGEMAALRLTLAPGTWHKQLERGLSPELWRVSIDDMAYFKSLFVAEKFQAKGLGTKLSLASIENLKKSGGKAVLCHSWLESPNNSSQRYLIKLGFSAIAQFPKFWYPIDYHCTRCGPKRCECTAVEMVKYI